MITAQKAVKLLEDGDRVGPEDGSQVWYTVTGSARWVNDGDQIHVPVRYSDGGNGIREWDNGETKVWFSRQPSQTTIRDGGEELLTQ
jgi:hypothetical protein